MHTQILANNKLIFRHRLTENNFFLLACLLCGLPVWLTHFPPMVDLPQHAAQVSLFLNLGNPDFPFSNQFQLKFIYTLSAGLHSYCCCYPAAGDSGGLQAGDLACSGRLCAVLPISSAPDGGRPLLGMAYISGAVRFRLPVGLPELSDCNARRYFVSRSGMANR